MRMQHPHRPNLRMVDLTRDEDVNMAVAGPSNAGNQAAAAAPLAPPAAAPDVNDAEFDRFQLTSLITNLYTGFLAMFREEIRLNNVQTHTVLNYGALKHRRAMIEIDRFFADTSVSRTVDADLIRYVAECDPSKMNAIDRVRMHLISLEIDRTKIEGNRMRLKRKRGQGVDVHMACPVCLVSYDPDTVVIAPQCGHLICQTCVDNIFDRMRENCPACRRVLDRDEMDRILLKFNHNDEPICRICDTPFSINDADVDWCNYFRCGHVYHKSCIATNDNVCTACNTVIGTGDLQHAYLNFE